MAVVVRSSGERNEKPWRPKRQQETDSVLWLSRPADFCNSGNSAICSSVVGVQTYSAEVVTAGHDMIVICSPSGVLVTNLVNVQRRSPLYQNHRFIIIQSTKRGCRVSVSVDHETCQGWAHTRTFDMDEKLVEHIRERLNEKYTATRQGKESKATSTCKAGSTSPRIFPVDTSIDDEPPPASPSLLRDSPRLLLPADSPSPPPTPKPILPLQKYVIPARRKRRDEPEISNPWRSHERKCLI